MFVEELELAGRDLVAYALALGVRRHMAWLDGAGDCGDTGRFSFLGCDPIETHALCADGDLSAALDRMAQPTARTSSTHAGFNTARLPRWAGYVAYDATWLRSDVVAPRHVRPGQPVLWFARYDAWLVLDHVTATAHLIGDDRDACDRLRKKLTARSRSAHAHAGAVVASAAGLHTDAIEHALSEIARGNLYQVNLARSFTATLQGDPLALFLAMRAQGNVPLGMYLDAGDHQVLARTMESFLRWNRATRVLETRPIKGTIARSGHADQTEAEWLRNDDKERAEHAMIVDLMRNDLGRVADVGSVEPVDVMRVEPFAGLSHLVSTVRCRTRVDISLAEIFDATFPPGSVTGTPKLSAIAQIEALESEPRGVYTGVVGLIDHGGGCDFAVAIRTAVVREGAARYFAGGGIVEASQVSRELAETELKARVFVDALAALADR